MPDKMLYANEWLSMYMRDDWFVFAHRSKSNGVAVAVLPFIIQRYGLGPLYCIRLEHCPPWGEGFSRCAVTGTPEGADDTPPLAAARELGEETGYSVAAADLMPLGTCRGSKMMDTLYHLFAADVTGLEPGEIVGDGTRGEEGASIEWTSDPSSVVDPMVPMMAVRLESARARGEL